MQRHRSDTDLGTRRCARAFTMVEMIVVIIILAILAGVALPKMIDLAPKAKQSADTGSIGGINEALQQKFGHNRITGANSSVWITAASQVAGAMETGKLPDGIILSGTTFTDQRGNTYTFTAETASAAARLAANASAASSSNGSGGSASFPLLAVGLTLAPLTLRPSRQPVAVAA